MAPKVYRSLQKACSKQPDLHQAHKTSEEQAAALDPIPPCCQRRTEALSAHPSGSRALLISGTAYLCPFHSRHGAGGNSVPCIPEHPSIPESDGNLAEREGGDVPSESGVTLEGSSGGLRQRSQPAAVTAVRTRTSPAMRRARTGMREAARTRCQQRRGCPAPPQPVTPSKDGDGEQLPPASAGGTAQVGFHLPWAGAARRGRKKSR